MKRLVSQISKNDRAAWLWKTSGLTLGVMTALVGTYAMLCGCTEIGAAALVGAGCFITGSLLTKTK